MFQIVMPNLQVGFNSILFLFRFRVPPLRFLLLNDGNYQFGVFRAPAIEIIEDTTFNLDFLLFDFFFGFGFKVFVKWFRNCFSSILNKFCSFMAIRPCLILSLRYKRDSRSAECKMSVGRWSSWLSRP